MEAAGLRQFAPVLNRIIESDPDQFCRNAAIHAVGALRAAESLPVLLRLAERDQTDSTWPLAWALKDFATEDCRPYLRKWLDDAGQPKNERVVAAWGLGKLGDDRAIAYLIEMLREPVRRGEGFFEPVETLRATQALCDILGWPFEWNTAYMAEARAKIKAAGLDG